MGALGVQWGLGWVLLWGCEPGIRCIWAERPPRMGILFTCCPGPDKRPELWASAGPQTGSVTLEGLNSSKVEGRLQEDYNMGKCSGK